MQKKKFRVIWLIGIALLSLLLIAGCGATEEKPAQEPAGTEANTDTPAPAGKQKIILGHLVADQLHEFALAIGLEKGYFEEEGLEIERKEFQSGGMATQSFNELDVVMCGMNPVVIAKAQGMDMVVFQSLNHGGSALVVDPSISKFEDLDGQPVATPGVASIQHNVFTLIEKEKGIQSKKLTAKVTDMPIFAQKKEIKGAIGWEPWPSVVMETAGWKRLLGANDMMEDQQCCVWVTSRKYMEEHPDIIEKLVRINIKAAKYVRQHPEEAIKIMAKQAKQEESTIAKAFENMIYPWPPKINRPSTKAMVENALGQKLIDAKSITPDIDTWLNGLIDESVLDKMIQDGYLDKIDKEGVPK